MEGPPVGSLALSGAGYTLDKTRTTRPALPGGRIPRLVPNNEPVVPSKVTTVDALIKELRKAVHAMFCTVDPTIPSPNAYENYSRQAFRFFTTTNTITQECFHHKVVRLGLHATPRLCNELFRRIDQLDLGEIDYPTFAQRVFLPEHFFSPDEPSPIAATNSPTVRDRANRPGVKAPRVSAPMNNNASSSPRSSTSMYEYMALEELEKCVARKLEEKMPRGTTDLVAQAFRFFTNLETITFADFHRHLGMLQIQLSPPKCRELFVRFDKDGDGVIDTVEFVTTLFSKEYRANRPSSARSSRSESDQEPSLSTKQLVATIRERMDHISEERDRFQQTFMLFAKATGISHSDLDAAMKKLGLKLPAKQLQDLFATFDFDKTGDLDVNKFVQGVMLDDSSTSFWLSVKDRQKVEDSRRKLYSMAVASVQESWTIADIERMLREKIEQLGYPLRRFDKDGSGDIDLNEFIHGVLPPDYMGISWVAAADEMHRIAAKKKKEEALANPDQYMTEIEMESWSLDEIEMRIRDKIMQSTSRSSDTFRQAYKIFKKASHVTMDEFREHNSNDLDLQEFCMKILPPDYTHDGDHWSHSEKYKKERHRQKLEYVKRSKNGLIVLPKFIESHRFTRGHHVSHSFQEMQQESTRHLTAVMKAVHAHLLARQLLKILLDPRLQNLHKLLVRQWLHLKNQLSSRPKSSSSHASVAYKSVSVC
ncbi:EF-hand domain pair [Phytophthora infestans]|uniref:EF-hand domain pair n=1 Tax=Phytophthora infestans TaxID=4787 RepID=A0A833ST87_PHYIN|nr:EF-hand domain pair [Phytophthora infestans]